MTGIYLECDECAKTLGGEEVTKGDPKYPRGLSWSQSAVLREAALKLGWTGPLGGDGRMLQTGKDLCPECAPSTDTGAGNG